MSYLVFSRRDLCQNPGSLELSRIPGFPGIPPAGFAGDPISRISSGTTSGPNSIYTSHTLSLELSAERVVLVEHYSHHSQDQQHHSGGLRRSLNIQVRARERRDAHNIFEQYTHKIQKKMDDNVSVAPSIARSCGTTATVPQITKHTEDKTLDNGTRIIKHVTEIKQEHEYGGTFVKNTNTRKIEMVEVEERIIGEDLSPLDCLLCCCPFLKRFTKNDKKKKNKKKKVDESKWKPVQPKKEDTKWDQKKKEDEERKAKEDEEKRVAERDRLRRELDELLVKKP